MRPFGTGVIPRGDDGFNSQGHDPAALILLPPAAKLTSDAKRAPLQAELKRLPVRNLLLIS
jgi:hypothetical protein